MSAVEFIATSVSVMWQALKGSIMILNLIGGLCKSDGIDNDNYVAIYDNDT